MACTVIGVVSTNQGWFKTIRDDGELLWGTMGVTYGDGTVHYLLLKEDSGTIGK